MDDVELLKQTLQKRKGIFRGNKKYKLDDFTPISTKQKIMVNVAAYHKRYSFQLFCTLHPRADQKRLAFLYCGTEYGMYISYDNGANWKIPIKLPLVPVTDLTIRNNDLIVATQAAPFGCWTTWSVLQQKMTTW